jgi:hypothetical protein
VYQDVRGWESFEPWLSRVENFDAAVIHEIAGAVPPEWTGDDWKEMETLTAAIVERRGRVRELITAFRNSTRQPFPAWGQPATDAPAIQKSAVQ